MSLYKRHVILDARYFYHAVTKGVESWYNSSLTSKDLRKSFCAIIASRYPIKNYEAQKVTEKPLSQPHTTHAEMQSSSQNQQYTALLDQPVTQKTHIILWVSAILFILGIILGVLFMLH